MIIDHEVEQGNAEAAARLLEELEKPAEGLVRRFLALRSRAKEATSRLRKLERIEQAVDPNAENSGKFRIMVLAAMSQALVFLAFGYLGRTGTYAAGSLAVGVFYSVYLLPQLGAEIVARRVMHANDLNRRLSQFGAIAVAAHASMFLVAHALQLLRHRRRGACHALPASRSALARGRVVARTGRATKGRAAASGSRH